MCCDMMQSYGEHICSPMQNVPRYQGHKSHLQFAGKKDLLVVLVRRINSGTAPHEYFWFVRVRCETPHNENGKICNGLRIIIPTLYAVHLCPGSYSFLRRAICWPLRSAHPASSVSTFEAKNYTR